jgi:hypothetical protein
VSRQAQPPPPHNSPQAQDPSLCRGSPSPRLPGCPSECHTPSSRHLHTALPRPSLRLWEASSRTHSRNLHRPPPHPYDLRSPPCGGARTHPAQRRATALDPRCVLSKDRPSSEPYLSGTRSPPRPLAHFTGFLFAAGDGDVQPLPHLVFVPGVCVLPQQPAFSYSHLLVERTLRSLPLLDPPPFRKSTMEE